MRVGVLARSHATGGSRARSSTRAFSPTLALAALVACALGGGPGCSVREVVADAAYRGPTPLAPALAAPFVYDPSAPRDAPTFEELALRPNARHLRGVFADTCPARAEPIEVRFELFLSTAPLRPFAPVPPLDPAAVASPRGAAEASSAPVHAAAAPVVPRPIVLLLPILGGSYGVSRLIADACAEAGWHAFFVHRADRLLDGDNDPADIDALTRRAVFCIQRTLDWALAQPDVDPARVALVGVSLGAILGTVVASVEPRIGAKVLVMGGADLPTIVRDSVEQGVHRYKIARMDRLGLTSDEAFERSMRDALRIDPLAYASAIDARTVLQLVTLYDNRVPTRNQWLLWEALGRPRAATIPSGHYTLALHSAFALGAMRSFLAASFEEPAQSKPRKDAFLRNPGS